MNNLIQSISKNQQALPLETQPISSVKPHDEENAQSVLIVDDEPMLLRLMKRILEKKFNIATCPDAQSAVTLLENRTLGFNAVISDYQMPSKDGIWLLERVSKTQPKMKRILTSSIEPPGLTGYIRDGVVQEFVSKPFHREELIAALKLLPRA